jgi:hypothetical protein
LFISHRAGAHLDGRRPDPHADLQAFVEYSWPERPILRGRAGSEPRLLVTNPGRASRYLSALGIEVDGSRLEPGSLVLLNESPGETGTPVRASELGPERGFYLRRGQEASVALRGIVLEPGAHRVRAELGLGGVTSLVLDEHVEFVP